MKIRELLTDESKWTKKDYAKASDGECIGSLNPNAVCWCLFGALERCYYTKDMATVINKIERKIGGHLIVTWNDAPERTFAEVKQLVEELDI